MKKCGRSKKLVGRLSGHLVGKCLKLVGDLVGVCPKLVGDLVGHLVGHSVGEWAGAPAQTPHAREVLIYRTRVGFVRATPRGPSRKQAFIEMISGRPSLWALGIPGVTLALPAARLCVRKCDQKCDTLPLS